MDKPKTPKEKPKLDEIAAASAMGRTRTPGRTGRYRVASAHRLTDPGALDTVRASRIRARPALTIGAVRHHLSGIAGKRASPASAAETPKGSRFSIALSAPPP
jgi:hypothetical protein